MRALVTAFNGLPPQMRVLIAMAGLTTPIGIIFLLQRTLGISTLYLLLGLALLIGVGALVSTLVGRVFNRSARKRERRMAADLASGAESGPVSMDMKGTIRQNNDKFFGAIRDLRKRGISVYDLPWYVVLGDSEVGKTKLINEGGLTFALGKPEGHQLGTLNYNWWFTEDAIFIDMAGRLCNPRDDADHREWQAFLKTIATGRKGYPINGVLACISAEHLLKDPTEKHEYDANTMLERLRDLQEHLGVTFATYLVVTKCDRILGFMQFFDRAKDDLTVKNQIFGFSRAGEFSALYDPRQLGHDFDAVYARLNDLRLRRLRDESDEAELGLAYGFPEEFRQLREPLQTYVRTLFPAIKNPRIVKNLIFRGVYFTCATQQGTPILRRLAARLGDAQAAQQFQPLESLYPRPRPFFVRDLLFEKVFREQGLVFRNEREVLRNRRLARALTVGTTVLGVVLACTLGVSFYKFNQLIHKPQEDAKRVNDPNAPVTVKLAFDLASGLGTAAEGLKGSLPARVLSLWRGTDQPTENLFTIQAWLFERQVLPEVLTAVEQRLHDTKITDRPGEPAGAVSLADYQAALQTYLAWFACGEQGLPPAGREDCYGLKKLCAVVPNDAVLWTQFGGRSPSEARKQLLYEAARYSASTREPRPARCLTPDRALGTIQAAIAKLHEHLKPSATLDTHHPDPVISEWMRLRGCCVEIDTAYRAILAAQKPTETQEQLEEFGQVFRENYERLKAAMAGCTWKLKGTGSNLQIPSLREALLKQRTTWLGYQGELSQAYADCGTPAGAKNTADATINALIFGNDADLRGLPRVMWESIVAAGLAKAQPYSPDLFGNSFDKLVHEVDDAYGHILAIKRAGDSSTEDRIELTADLQEVRRVLDEVQQGLASLAAGSAGAASMQAWITALTGLYPKPAEPGSSAATISALQANWQPEKLARLNDTYLELIRRGAVTAVLRAIQTRLQATEPWALAELEPDWRTMQRSAYVIRLPIVAEAPVARTETAALPSATPPRETPDGPLPPPFGQAKTPAQPPTPSAPPPAAERGADAGLIPKCTSPEFLNARAQECVYLTRILADFGPAAYFSRAADAVPLNEQCIKLVERAWQRYCGSYIGEWDTAYANAPLAQAERFARWDQGWEAYANQFKTGANTASNDARSAIRGEFRSAVSEILHAVRWPAYTPEHGAWLELPDQDCGVQMGKIKRIYEAAVHESWKHGDFASTAAAPDTGAVAKLRPWDALADELATRWTEWCNAVGADAVLPRKFDVAQAVKPTPISWDTVTKLQIETHTQEERFTGQLVEFQKKAQSLLSDELTNRLCAIQTGAFADQVPYGGWPYLNEAGTQLTALEVVDFGQFKNFLTLVQKAADTLQPLDASLPDDALRRARQDFVQACEKWRDFLRLNAQGATTPLDVTVSTADPIGAPDGKEHVDDSAQHYYRNVRLAIGLRRQETGGLSAVRPLEFTTTADAPKQDIQAVWGWTRAPEQSEFSFELVDGIQPERQDFRYPDISPRVLGKPSALAFCAFLHRYGIFVDGNWITTFGVNLAEKFKAANKGDLVSRLPSGETIVGEKFVFQLPSGRDLPEPIAKLTPTAGAPTTRP